jgi:hypothetical protein
MAKLKYLFNYKKDKMSSTIMKKLDKIFDTLDVNEIQINQLSLLIDDKIDLINEKLDQQRIKISKTIIDKKYENSVKEAQILNAKNGVVGKLRIGKIHSIEEKGRKYPISFGFKNVKISKNSELQPTNIKIFVVSMKQMVTFHNFWEFTKLYISVPKQNQKNGWIYPFENHFDENEHITESYWHWRESGFKSKINPRFPAGYSKPIAHVFPDCEFINNLSIATMDEFISNLMNPWFPQKLVNLATAQKIYNFLYFNAIEKLEEYQNLLSLLKNGYNLQILSYNLQLEGNGIYGDDNVGSEEFDSEKIQSIFEYILCDILEKNKQIK